jgi:hypothetical protein
MRVAIPNLEIKEQIHQTGIALISLFANDLFQFIDTGLQKSDGINWLTDYRKTQLDYANYNFSDPGNLLKEIIRFSSSPLRKPLRLAIPQRESVAFYDRLEIVLEDRNDWVHHHISAERQSLKTLIFNLYPICEKLQLSLKYECDQILGLLDGVELDISVADPPVVTSSKVETNSDVLREIVASIPEEESRVGDLVDKEFLKHSYTLHLSGEIRDRKTDRLLSSLYPQTAAILGALMIARKPNGGRLRVTSEGIISAYFENHWGYLATVKSDQWFPGHL